MGVVSIERWGSSIGREKKIDELRLFPLFFLATSRTLFDPSCSHKHHATFAPIGVIALFRVFPLASHSNEKMDCCAASGHVTRRAGVVRMVRVMVVRMMATVLFHAIAMLLAALGNSRDDALVLNVVWVVGLNVGSEAVECPLKRIFGGRVHHTWLSRQWSV